MNSVNKNITRLLKSKISNLTNYRSEIIKALNILLNGSYSKYNIEESINEDNKIELSDKTFQDVLAHLNEKSNMRKLNGVYYTPSDVSKYIICNSLINRFIKDNDKTHNYSDGSEMLYKLDLDAKEKLMYHTTFIDPTCGSGEFLVSVFEQKYVLLDLEENKDDTKILNICKTIYGNDIDAESLDISKIRLFFYIANLLNQSESYVKLARILKKQFYNVDFISNSNAINKKFDIVIGNPPYIEYGKYKDKNLLKNQFGNVYADVIMNSIELLKPNGVLGFIIPISYTSTPRMKLIRDYVKLTTEKQFILNFADRPDCLFNGVHQKLNILICKKGSKKNKTYTSNYKHWYSDERSELLNGRDVIQCDDVYNEFIPKIGNNIEYSIFKKIYTKKKNNLYDNQKSQNSIYLNMRACFWVKAFKFNPGSNEYKKFNYSKGNEYFSLCILNSSLFWLYWTIVSDCWHITTKELKTFYMPKIDNHEIFENLYKQLEDKLEQTKKYVGTKQVDYEYKHKYCKKIIDKIDEELAKIYGLTSEELNYIKTFALIYRMGGTND